MAKALKKKKCTTVATARSTSGAGFAFEDLVAADFLSHFLNDLPIDGLAIPGDRLLSQANATGWSIDDLVCIGRNANGAEHRLAISCKSNLQVTANGWPADFIKPAWPFGARKTHFAEQPIASG